MAVGRALEAQLAVPEHSLRVTAHHPEHYLVIFSQPAQQVNAQRRASIRVDGAIFNVAYWHEHDHASFGSLLLHVRVVIEGVPMHLWSVEGEEEILGRRVRVDRLGGGAFGEATRRRLRAGFGPTTSEASPPNTASGSFRGELAASRRWSDFPHQTEE
ncbi:hypothetical protein ZWY2020_022300 [Hordeum vulgare]|nr:hypothetical protein ZWY2020_022300 [Hordeum vulgare]